MVHTGPLYAKWNTNCIVCKCVHLLLNKSVPKQRLMTFIFIKSALKKYIFGEDGVFLLELV